MNITWRVFSGEGERKNRGENLQGRRSIIGRHKIDRRCQNDIGNREVRELICTTHEHELRGGNAGDWGVQGTGEVKAEKLRKL